MIIRCIDFETSGFPPKAGVCEVGWTDVTVDRDGAVLGETFAHLCNPGMPISEGAARVHGITDAMVAGEPAASDMFLRLMNGADIFCAHFAEFETAFFGGGETPWIYTCKVAQALYPSLPNHKNGELPIHFGIALDEHRAIPLHRAGPDTYVTAMNLAFMLMKGALVSGDVLKHVREFIDITRKPREIRVMPFGKHKGTAIDRLPIDYLRWAVENMTAIDVRDACRREMNRRAP